MQVPTNRVKEFQEKLFRINMDDLIRQTKKEHKQEQARPNIIAYLILGALLCSILMLMPRTYQELKASTALPTPTPAAMSVAPATQPAPRAQLIPMPVAPAIPRAELLHVRGIGTVENDRMPDGRILTTRYMGELPSAAQLPRSGAQLGDMWFTRADSHCWVLAPLGAGSSTIGWVDP